MGFNKRHIFPIKFSKLMGFFNSHPTIIQGVERVFSVAHPLKVFGAIVVLVPVFMVYGHSFSIASNP